MRLHDIKNKTFFARGKRGVIYTVSYKGKKVAIKTKRPDSKAIDRIKNEARWMRFLNKYNIGPRFISFENNELMYKFVEGDFILDYFEKANKTDIIKVVKELLGQMYKMDKLKVNKLEMHHPVKHIVVKNNKPVLLDFERCYKTEKPKNVTQFCQFLISKHVNNLLKEKGIRVDRKKIIELAKKYKENTNKKNLNKILMLF